jgi:hypothetical protein
MRAPTKRGIEEKKLDELLKPKPGENLRTLPPPKPVE